MARENIYEDHFNENTGSMFQHPEQKCQKLIITFIFKYSQPDHFFRISLFDRIQP